LSIGQGRTKPMSKFVRRDKLVDMQVYDCKGRFVGTVKDIGFIPGENTVGLVVTTKDKSEVEIHWSEVASIEDIVLLEKDFPVTTVVGTSGLIPAIEEEKPINSSQKQALPPEVPAMKPEQAQKATMRTCHRCGAENDAKYKFCHKCGAKLTTGL